jgi:UPF0042 nucleotide-binding protein
VTEFVVISGLSGAGRSSVADVLEDLGWFVIDNLPTPLIPKVGELASMPGSTIERVALVVGSGADPDDVLPALVDLRSGSSRMRVLYLEATTGALVRRYESTRRRHPHSSDDSVSEAIERERAMLEPVKGEADLVLDTSDLNIHQLRARVMELFGGETPESGMRTTILSFGYKHGLPTDVDMVIDCRFLPNPYWDEQLRPLTGQDDPVRANVLGQEATGPFLEKLEGLLELLVPAYIDEGKAYLTIALGCTGGRHRAVVIAEELAVRLRRHGVELAVKHRDVGR